MSRMLKHRLPRLESLEERIAPVGDWVFQGPAPVEDGQLETDVFPNQQVTGAIQTVVAHPVNPDVLWAGSVNGGIWKTNNATSVAAGQNPTWVPQTDFLGSLSIGAMAMDTTDSSSNTLVAGTAKPSHFHDTSGTPEGVYLTTDGGATWSNPGSAGLGINRITDVAIRSSTIVVTSRFTPGGVFRSTDGGANFTHIRIDPALSLNQSVSDLAEDLSDPSKGPTSQRLYLSNRDDAVYRSEDFGATWTKISGPAGGGDNATMDALINQLNNTQIELAVSPQTGRLYGAVLTGNQMIGIFYTDNPTATTPVWTQMDMPVLPLGPAKTITGVSNTSPIVITSPNHGLQFRDMVVIGGVTGTTAANGFFRVTNNNLTANTFELELSAGNGAYTGGGTWTKVTQPTPTSEGPTALSEARFSIVVDPTDEDIVYVAGNHQVAGNPIGDTTLSGAVYRGDASIARDQTAAPSPQWDHITHNSVAIDPAGGTANNTAPHADSRAMVFDAAGNLIEADNGGVFKRTSPRDNTGDWSSLAGSLGVLEIHDIAYDSLSNVLIAGTQDNGTVVQTTGAGGQLWRMFKGEDGGDVVVDNRTSATSSIRYTSTRNLGNFERHTFNAAGNLTATTALNTNVLTPTAFVAAPKTAIELNAVNPARMVLMGANGVFESSNASTTTGNLDLTQVASFTPSSLQDAMAFGASANPDALYVGQADKIWVRTGPGPLTQRDPGPSFGDQIADVVMDPDGNGIIAFAVDTIRVWMTTDGGATWSQVTGDLASQAPGEFRSIEYIPGASNDVLVVGSDRGVFAAAVSGLSSATTWVEIGEEVLPNALAYDLEYNAADDILVVGTLGRGAWVLQNPNAITGPEINVVGLNNITIPDGDTTPRTTDGTNFGNLGITSSPLEMTFTIENRGLAGLSVGPYLITGPHFGNFTTVGATPGTILPGGTKTVTVSFDPSAAGLRRATLSIISTDSDEGTYNFDLWGTGIGGNTPEIEVFGNGLVIVDNDPSPSTEDDTDFGNAEMQGGPVDKTFTVTNVGGGVTPLTLQNITVTGINASDFTVIQQPPATLAAGASGTFTIRFDPSALGLRRATLNMGTNDGDENPFNFLIRGTGIDTVAPTVAINQAATQADPTNLSPINFTVVFSENVTGFTGVDVTLGGTAGATTAVVTGSGTTYNVAVSGMTVDGTVIASIAAGAAVDIAGLTSTASTSTDNAVLYNTTNPIVTIGPAVTQPNPTNSPSIVFTVVFTEPVFGFESGDVALSGTAGATTVAVTGSGTTYDVTVSGMTGDGTVIINIPAGVAVDGNGDPNLASTSTANLVDFDITPPTVAVNQAATQADPTNSSPINFTVVFSEAVTGFTDADVTLSGTAGATTAVVTGSGTTYNVAVSGMTSDGTVIVTIGAGVAVDAAGNANLASASTDNTVTFDVTAPAVVVNQAATQADPTNSSPINFTVVFSEAVTGFTDADVTLGGTAGATTAVVTGSGTTYNVAVSGMTSDGTVIVTIGAGVAVDAAGNANLASASTDNTVAFDVTGPAVTVNQAATQADPTSSSLVNFTVVFSEAVTGFDANDVTLGGTAGATTAVVTGSGTTYNVAVSGMTTSGTVIVTIGAGVVTDALGNANLPSTSTDNTVAFDVTGPAVTVNQAATQADPTSSSLVNFTVVFSEAVTGFTVDDVTLGGTAGATTAVVTGSGTTYNVAVSGMTSDGTVIVTIAGGVAIDAAGNANLASTSTDNTVTFDGTPPAVTVNRAATQADPTNVATINFTVVFSEAVTGFTSDDVTLGGTAGATTAVVTGSGTTYNVAVSGISGNGTVTVTIAAGVAIDALGNPNTASTGAGNIVTIDTVSPTVTVSQATGQPDPAGSSPINFTVVFSEDVIGFTGSDVTLGGTAGATTAVVTGSGNTYNVAVSGMTTDGTVIITIAAGAATDAAGNGNAPSINTDNTVTFDVTPPAVTVNRGGTQVNPTASPTINFTVVFSEAVTGFTDGEVILSGTAGATTAVVTGSGTTYNVAVSGMTSDGTVIVTIAAGVAVDAAGNANLASTSTDNTVTLDTLIPTVTINQAITQADPTNSPTIHFTVVFSEAVVGFTASDVILSGTAGATTAVVTGSGTTYNVAVSGMTADGTVIASVAAGAATDAADNANPASTSTDNSVLYDATRPRVTVNRAITQADPTGTSPINFTVVFSQAVTGFTSADVILGGTAGATTAVVTGSGTTYNVAVSGMTTNGTVIVTVAEGVAVDEAGNTTVASTGTDNTVTFDPRPPLTTGPIIGTEQDDVILLQQGSDNLLEVTLNGVVINRVDPNSLNFLVIEGLAGNDRIEVASDVRLPVFVEGGAGNDTIIGSAGNDTILGGAGDDLIFGGEGDDQMFGEDGNDAMDGQRGNDSLGGGIGNDLMFGSSGNDLMFGELGNDAMDGGTENDNLDGGEDNDLLFGFTGNDLLFGGNGNDSMDAGSGDDGMDGGSGDDLMFGLDGNDLMFALAGNDIMDGGAGDDIMDAGNGNDLVFGSSGNDLIFGGGGNDSIDGNDGQDSIDGGDGDDLIFGSGGIDLIFAGLGNDSVDGGAGVNSVDGGPGVNLIFN